MVHILAAHSCDIFVCLYVDVVLLIQLAWVLLALQRFKGLIKLRMFLSYDHFLFEFSLKNCGAQGKRNNYAHFYKQFAVPFHLIKVMASLGFVF